MLSDGCEPPEPGPKLQGHQQRGDNHFGERSAACAERRSPPDLAEGCDGEGRSDTAGAQRRGLLPGRVARKVAEARRQVPNLPMVRRGRAVLSG